MSLPLRTTDAMTDAATAASPLPAAATHHRHGVKTIERRGRTVTLVTCIVGIAVFSALLATGTAHAKLSSSLAAADGWDLGTIVDAPLLLQGATTAAAAVVGDDGSSSRRRRYHVVFSTDCSPYQRWQSYALFHSALKVGQPGRVTRIASGCSSDDDERGEAEVDWHDEHVKGPMSNDFGIHLTPHYSAVTDENGTETGKLFSYFNKPFGLRHWMEHGEGMGIDPDTGKLIDEDAIVILLDPDQIILRPLGDDFSDDNVTLVSDIHAKNRKMKVEHGSPFGQYYGLRDEWTDFNLTRIAGPDSPAGDVSKDQARRGYPVGPPYVATAGDMYRIAVRWTETVRKVHVEYPHLLAEMYAYCIAAADRRLPHQIVRSMMVSNTGDRKVIPQEGWSFVDRVPAEEVCKFASDLDYRKHPLPNVLHYCQQYNLGRAVFSKHRLPANFFACESPMLIEQPGDIAVKYDYLIPPPKKKGTEGEKKPVDERIAKREAFMLCALTAQLNEAAEFFKRHSCGNKEGEEETNWEKSLDLWQP